MRRKPWNGIVPTLATLVALVGAPAMAQAPEKSTTEKLKEKVGGAVQSLKKGAATAEEALREQYARARAAVVKMGVEARVYARLHWEKALVGSKIELSGPGPGIVALSGTVVDARAKIKALELARDTIGVNQVIDHLIVQTATSGAVKTEAP